MKKMAVMGMAAAALLSLTGCSKSNGQSAKADKAPDPGPSTGTISVMNFAQPAEKAILDKVIKHYEETHPGVTVDVITVTQDEYGPKLQALLAANKLPDVFYMGPESVRQYVDNKKVLALDDFVYNATGADVTDLYEAALNDYRYNGKLLGQGKLYALPKDFGPAALAYNKTLFEKYGIPLPSPTEPYTWEEFIDVCKQCTKDLDGNGENDTFGTGLNVNWSLHQFIWGNGADYLDSTGTKVAVTDPKFVEALQFFADQTNVYQVTPNANQAASLDTYQRWLKGELGFFLAGSWDISTFNTTLPFEYDLIPWPVHNKGDKTATYRGGVGWAVAANTKMPQAAADLALYLSADKEANQMYVDQDLQLPNLKSLASAYIEKPSMPANRQEFIHIISESGRPWPYNQTYNRVWYDDFFLSISKVLDGSMTAKEYCEKVAPKMQKDLDKALSKVNKE